MLPPLIEKKIQDLAARRDELTAWVSSPASAVEGPLYAARARELGILGKRVAKYDEYLRLRREIEDNESLVRGRTPSCASSPATSWPGWARRPSASPRRS